MRIVGEWRYCDDGVTRPVLHVKVQGVDGVNHSGRFLVDSGADRTVLSAYLLNELGFPTTPTTQDFVLEGIGGESDFVNISAMVERLFPGRFRNRRPAPLIHTRSHSGRTHDAKSIKSVGIVGIGLDRGRSPDDNHAEDSRR